MANTIRIKRRAAGASGAPSSLENAELAFNEVNDVLYYGEGTGGAGGTATTVLAIGGSGAFVTLSSEQTISGNKTFSGTVALGSSASATTQTAGDNSTKVATTGYVDAAVLAATYNFTLAGDSGTSQTIDDAETVTISGGTGLSSVASSANTITLNLDNTAVTAGSYGSGTQIPTFTVDAQGRLTAASYASISTTLTVGADSGTADGVALATDTLTFSGGEGIDTTVTNNTITIAGEDATTSNKGIASFSSDSFSVSSGAVSIKSGGVTNSQLVNSTITLGSSTLTLGSTTTSITGITELTVDNINFNGNTISTTDSNGDLVLSPNGTGRVDVSSSRIIGLAEPVDDTDAATKGYVDAARSGLDVKQSVRAATTEAINLASELENGDVIDGVTLVTSDRVLVKHQSTASQNGIYVVQASGAAVRATDFDGAGEVSGGAFTFVEEGTVNADSGWVVTSNGAITVGTDAINWVQFSGAGQITAGAGLTKSGNTIDVGGTADRITVNADSVDIASTYVGQATITTLGTIGTGTWQGTIVGPTYGGTGVNNGSKTITLGGNLETSGAHNTTLTTTATTSLTLPTTGTLATLAGVESFTNKTIDASNIGVTTRGTGAFTSLAANSAVTFTAATASSSYTTGTLVVTGGVGISGALYGNSSVLSGFTIDGGTF